MKKNQPLLYETIKECGQGRIALDTHVHIEKKRGATTTWTTRVYEPIPNVTTMKWEDMKRFIITDKTVTKGGKVKESTAYRITDIMDLSAQKLYEGIRGHWGIENRTHWVRDVGFNEDKNKIINDNAAVNMAFFNTLAINYLRENFEDSIKYSQISFGQNMKESYRKART